MGIGTNYSPLKQQIMFHFLVSYLLARALERSGIYQSKPYETLTVENMDTGTREKWYFYLN